MNIKNLLLTSICLVTFSSPLLAEQCARENQTCVFSGSARVSYGAGDKWTTKQLTGPVACNNATFGDPAPNVVKSCYLNTIMYGETVGVFSEDNRVRLDIGTRAVKEDVPASHSSWATRLKIRRIDGVNLGPIGQTDLVGVFSEDGKVRLDVGIRAMKEEVPASHVSWATKLKIHRLDGPNSGPVQYGQLVGIFSEDGKVRLDVGTRAMKEDVPASHISWATKLRIKKQ